MQLPFWPFQFIVEYTNTPTDSRFYLHIGRLHNTFREPHWRSSYLDTSNRCHWIVHIYKSFAFFKMLFSHGWGLNTTCSIFSFQNDLLCCSFSIQGLFHKIPVLFLQIQGVFKEKVISKEFSRPKQFFLAHANHGVALDCA